MDITIKNVEYSKIVQSEICSSELSLNNVPVSLANSLRRIVLSEIPNVAFYEKDINVIENKSDSCKFHSETFAHQFNTWTCCNTNNDYCKVGYHTASHGLYDVPNLIDSIKSSIMKGEIEDIN